MEYMLYNQKWKTKGTGARRGTELIAYDLLSTHKSNRSDAKFYVNDHSPQVGNVISTALDTRILSCSNRGGWSCLYLLGFCCAELVLINTRKRIPRKFMPSVLRTRIYASWQLFSSPQYKPTVAFFSECRTIYHLFLEVYE